MRARAELREIAKEALVDALAKAYYTVSDNPEKYELSEEETMAVVQFMNGYGKTMCKAIRKEYYTA